MRQPEDVFTPRAIASREMFARRNEPDLLGNPGLQDTLTDALRDSGAQILLYGDTGVGKSSLVDIATEDEKVAKVVMECMSSDTFDDLVDKAIKQMISVKELSRSSGKDGAGEIEAVGGLSSFLNVKGTIKRGWFMRLEFVVLQKHPVDALFDAMVASKKRVLVLDNFQNVLRAEDRTSVAQAMELLADRAKDGSNVKIIVIGIASDASALLSGSGSYTRRTVQIGVPRMPDDEVREVFSRGFGFLDIKAQSSIIEELIRYSDGFPYFAHLLGLHVSRAARKSGSSIDASSVEAALERATREVGASYADRLQQARELSGEVRPREQILRLLSESDQRSWSAKEVQAAWERKFSDGRGDFAFMFSALGALVTKKYGSMLHRTGAAKSYRYQFEDPQLRPYLRIAFRERN